MPKLRIGGRAPASVVAQGFFMLHPAYKEQTTAVKMQRAFLSAAGLSEISRQNCAAPYVLAEGHPLRCAADSLSPVHAGENGIYIIIDLGAEESGCFELDLEAPPVRS